MTTSLTQAIDNAILALIVDLIDKGDYNTASIAVNKLEKQQSLNKALDTLGNRLNVSKLKDSIARRCLTALTAENDTRLLPLIVNIVRSETDAKVIGFKVVNLLERYGLADANNIYTYAKIEDVELEQFNL